MCCIEPKHTAWSYALVIWNLGKWNSVKWNETRRIWAIFACFYVARFWQRQLGFLVFDENLTFSDHISSLSKSCYSHIVSSAVSVLTLILKQPVPLLPLLSTLKPANLTTYTILSLFSLQVELAPLVTLARPSVSSSLQITNRSFTC